MRGLIVALLALCFGCQPIYVVESSKREFNNKIMGDRHYKTVALYHLPRTDLRVDAAVSTTSTTYGMHYCFAKTLGMGTGACADVCEMDDTKVTAVRSVEVTPVTLPDTSDLYSVRLRDKRRAVKRASEVKTTPNAVLTGAEATFSGSGQIAIAVAKGVADFVATIFGAAITTDAVKCRANKEAATEAWMTYKELRRCRDALTTMSAVGPFSVWRRANECRPIFANASIPKPSESRAAVAARELNEILKEFESKFGQQTTISNYTVQKWVQVEPAEAVSEGKPAKPIVLSEGAENSVGLCSLPDDSKTKEPPVQLCGHGEKDMLVELSLMSPPGTNAQPPKIRSTMAYDPMQERKGLVFRMPQTLLLNVDIRVPASPLEKPSETDADDSKNAETKKLAEAGKSELLASQVKEVTFGQMGTLVRLPNKLAGGKVKIAVEASSVTGMLTEILVSREHQVSGEEVGTGMSTLTKTGEVIKEKTKSSTPADDLESDNRERKAKWENECLLGERDDCDKMWWTD